VIPKNNTITSTAYGADGPITTLTYILASPSTSSTPTILTTSSVLPPTPSVAGEIGQPHAKSNTGPIIGALLGGLVVGGVVAATILFCLRSRRRQNSTRLVAGDEVPTYPPAGWEREKDGLLTQLNDVQAERAQLRTYLQVADTRDPRDIVELFDKLNFSIKNSCLLASGAVLKSAGFNFSGTTKDANNLPQLHKDLEGASVLIMSNQGKGRKIDEFLPLAFRYIVNLTLVNSLFSLFHPEVSKAENESLLETYRGIRHHDPQRLSARWRCSTYAAIDGRIPPSGDWPNHFADNVLKNLSSILSSIFGKHSRDPLPAKLRGELISIGAEAYKWNRTAKSTFYALDFSPVLFTSTDRFDPASMTLYLNHKSDELPPRHIVSAATLALMSTESIAVGGSIREDSVWQTKAEVLTEGFF